MPPTNAASSLTRDANTDAARARVQLTKSAWWWQGALWLLILSGWVVSHFNTTTLLTPEYDGVLDACFITVGVVAVVSGIVGYSHSKGTTAWRVAAAVMVFGLVGALGTGLLTMNAAEIALGEHYFPPGRTETFQALLPIGRAYRASSRTGNSWTIQPTPLWSNIDITEPDYDFMVTAKRVDDVRAIDEPDDITSNGVYCAAVTMQRSGDALRVLHAGNQSLPDGSVVRCPPTAAGQPYLPIRDAPGVGAPR